MGQEVIDLADDVPETVRLAVENLEWLFVPDEIPKESKVVYDRARKGRCMTCSHDCGEGTVIVGNGLGTLMIFCSNVCMNDMAVRGFLEELYQDMVDRIKFRAEEPRV